MRKRIAKRLWPVPVTLGVMALAALLAFGLMATNGAQPAEAQSDPCITVTAGAQVVASQVPTIPADATNADDDLGCDSTTASTTIKLNGRESVDAADVSNFVIFGPGIGGTAANVYPPGTTYGDHDSDATTDNTFFTGTAGTDAVVVAPLPAMRITVPTGTPGVDGKPVASSMSFDVTGKAPDTVTIYIAQGTEFTEDVTGTPPLTGGRASVMPSANRIVTVNILFLGEPAIGKDGADLNKDIDDADLEQCVLDAATNDDVVAESTDCANDAREGTATWVDSTAVTDALESRSKLVVRTGAANATEGDAIAIIDGGMKTHTMETDQDTVTIYALVEDGNGKELLDAEVSFRASTMPAGIVATRDLSDDVDTKPVATTGATSDDILVDGLSAVDNDPAVTDTNAGNGAIIENDDAVAAFELDSLPDAAADSYRIEVVVTVGDLTLGTVVLSKLGTPATIMGDTYNMACLPHPTDNDAGDFTDAKFGKVGQNDCALADRYGDDQMVVVKAHVVDSLGNPLDDEAENLEAKIGDAALTAVADAADGAAVWIYMIDTDANENPTALGGHMVTISHDDDDDDTTVANLTPMFTVAGPPASYMLVTPVDTIDLGGRAMFTVQAQDENMGLPYFSGGNNMVSIVVPDIAENLVRGLTNGMLALDEDTGMGTFTVYAPGDAMDGDTARIFVSSGDTEVSHTVTFGMMVDPMPELTAPTNVGIGSFNQGGVVQVYWDAVDGATGYIIIAIDTRDFAATAVPINNGAADGASIGGLMSGVTYDIYVASTSRDSYELSDAVQVTAN